MRRLPPRARRPARRTGAGLAAALALAAGPARAQAVDASLVTVHVDAPAGTELRGRPSLDEGSTVVCTAPCDRALDRGWLYSVEGSGSASFAAAPVGSVARVAVTPPPSQTPGRVAIVTGGLTYVVGEGMSVAWVVGLILHATGQPLRSWVAPLGIAGTSTAVTGALLLAAGAFYNLLTRESGHLAVTW